MNSILLDTLAGKKQEKLPIWFMRQAGRYLPEYQELRKKHKLRTLMETPEFSFEITMQPIRRYDFDAAIIFADILTPIKYMGFDFGFLEGVGPKIFNNIKDVKDIHNIDFKEIPKDDPTLNAIKITSDELKKINKPLIGFSAAPFTLSSYLIEGGSVKNLHNTRKLMLYNESEFLLLQEKLTIMIIDYLDKQILSGASVVQVFDSWLGILSPSLYNKFAKPFLMKIQTCLKEKHPNTPLVFFSTQSAGMFSLLDKLKFDCLGVDWRTNLSKAETNSPNTKVLQGNLDPIILTGPKEVLEIEVERILNMIRSMKKNIVFNLGHGILPFTPTENVDLVIKMVKAFSK